MVAVGDGVIVIKQLLVCGCSGNIFFLFLFLASIIHVCVGHFRLVFVVCVCVCVCVSLAS